MHGKRQQDWTGEASVDQRLIQLESSESQAGITAALRRAFEAVAKEPCDRDFEALLARLN